MATTDDQSPSPVEVVPALRTLGHRECELVLMRNDVGRLAYALHDRVNIVPIHFVYEDGWIYGRTEPGGKLVEILRNRRVAFEVDEHEGVFSWRSVIAHGPFYLIEHEGGNEGEAIYEHALELVQRLLPSSMDTADPVPFRTELFRIQVAEMTGRASSPGGTRIEPFKPDTRDASAHPEMDAEIATSVRAAIGPLVGPTSRVNVDVFDGVVVLSGMVETSFDRAAVEKAVISLGNVQAVVQQLETAFPMHQHEAPAELARQALRELRGNSPLQDAAVKLVVDHEWLRAEGSARDMQSKEEVLRRLRSVRGVRGVVDRIQLPT